MIYRLYVEYKPNTYVMVMQTKELQTVSEKVERLKSDGHKKMKVIPSQERRKSGSFKPVITKRKKLN
tara:strand:+ start:1406 stop:1606 length:201 start_codon:yes stop_codon:yes gene_type:complete